MGMTENKAGDFDFTKPMTKAATLSVYEGLRGHMPSTQSPQAEPRQPQHHDRLRDILSEFDALLLDGYGVLNIGSEAVPGADHLLEMAKSAGVETMVLTNGASKPTAMAWSKYKNFGFQLDPA